MSITATQVMDDRIGKTLECIDTPALLVDLDIMEANIRRWQAAGDAAGVGFRPHIKTHKIPAVAALQLSAGAIGLACAKVSEAEIFAAEGCRDIVVAYPVVGPSKWRRLALLARNCDITVNVESAIAAHGLSSAAVAAGSVMRVHLDIDTRLHRSGVQLEDAEALGRLIEKLPGLQLDGITTFRSLVFPGAAGRPRDEVARDEGETMVELGEQLRAAGLPIRTIAVGSTPTALAAARVPGVTEVRAGTYVFGDAFMEALGAVAENEIALTIMSTVVSRPTSERATIDAGSKTFSGDIAPNPKLPGLSGYGRLAGGDAHIEGLYEEHGIVWLGGDVSPAVGERLRFIPNHVCTAVNLSDEVIGVRDGRIETTWPVLARGMRT